MADEASGPDFAALMAATDLVEEAGLAREAEHLRRLVYADEARCHADRAVLARPVTEVIVRKRITDRLAALGVLTVGDLTRISPDQLMGPHVQISALWYVREQLAYRGLYLAGDWWAAHHRAGWRGRWPRTP